MHIQPDILGAVLHDAREKAEITVEDLAEKVGVTPRYIYRIENEGKKPSYEVLCKLIWVLAISPNAIFYPHEPEQDSEVAELLRMLATCDDKALQVVKATIKALLETAG